jgi:zinc protease
MKISIVLSYLLLSYGIAIAQTPKLVQKVEKNGDQIVIPFQKYVLSNGLTVILTEDHSDPIVHVNVTYHVGSAREEIGKSGFAHFFEHMMFEGSDHIKSGDHFKIITASGGTLNGQTSQDKTIYYETVPSNQLEKMLWLESDRMGSLLNAVTEKKFEIQRATVKNERGQNYDNQPYGLAYQEINKNLYPYGHPYSWLTIGYVEDLNRVDVNDLKRFFLRWYGPNNATLTIGGDINVQQTLAWVEKYFGTIPRGPEVTPTVLPAPVLTSDRYVSYKDNYAHLPMLYMAYPGVKIFDKDAPALDALSMIIGQGKTSLLYQNFIQTRKAGDAEMFSSNSELSGFIGIQIIPFPGMTLKEVHEQVQKTFEEFEKRGVTDEDLARYKGSSEAGAINSLASISGKVDELSGDQLYTGNPNQIGRELNDIEKVTKEDVMRVYEKYVKNKPSVILSILPKDSKLEPAGQDNYTVDTTHYTAPNYGYAGLTYHPATDNFDRTVQPPAGPNPVVKVPPFWKTETPNKIKMIGSYNNEIPTVTIQLSVKGSVGMIVNDTAKAGLPNIVARMLNEDTKNYSAKSITSKLLVLGSDLSVSASQDNITFSLDAITKNIDESIKLLEERLYRPNFTQESLDRIKKQVIQGMKMEQTEPANVANDIYTKMIYGVKNIRSYGLEGNEQTINNITLADVQNFYDKYFSSNLGSVVVVGDLTEQAAKEKLKFLNSWANKEVTVPAMPQPVTAAPKTVYYVNVPDAAQSEIRLGYYTGVKYDPTGLYYQLVLSNYILGGGFDSHLNIDLREDKGWTYGANSVFSSSKTGGLFVAQAGVRAAVTDSATMEFLKDMNDYAANGITDAELQFTKSSIGQSDARKYETNEQKATFLSRMLTYNLDGDYVTKQNALLNGLTKQTVDELAKQYYNTDKMIIVIVGDKGNFGPALIKAGYKLVELDTEGNTK